MFESAELGHEVSRAAFRRELPKLRERLLEAQAQLLETKDAAVLVLIGGVDGAGKGETVNTLNEWMDPRHIVTHAHGAPTDEERARPWPWRFWRTLPPKGKIGIFFGSWYTQPIVRRTYGELRRGDFEGSLDEIVRLEEMLVREGVILVKLWFHLGKAQQKKRLRALSKDKRTRWRVTDQDWKHFELYDDFRKVSELALRRTSTGHAPWHVIEGLDSRHRSLEAGRTLLRALEERGAQPPAPAALPQEPADPTNLLTTLDLSGHTAKKAYEERLEELQGRLATLTRRPAFQKTGVVCVFEGVDAAGKGGAIRRVTQALDARHYRVHPVAAPSSEERAQPYLWRFWRNAPPLGQIAIFDRSWYGRVLVERVEGFCSDADWQRAYSEINDFETRLDDHGLVVVKFWLHVDPKEQLRRFKERAATGFKRFKITAEDWRNRKKWKAYEAATCAMFDHTSTEIAPWTLVPANDKYGARLRVLETLIERVEAGLARAEKRGGAR